MAASVDIPNRAERQATARGREADATGGKSRYRRVLPGSTQNGIGAPLGLPARAISGTPPPSPGFGISGGGTVTWDRRRSCFAYRHEEQFALEGPQRAGCHVGGRAESEVIGFVVVKGDEVEQMLRRQESPRTVWRRCSFARPKRNSQRGASTRGSRSSRDRRARVLLPFGWRDSGPMSYLAETEVGPLGDARTHRYEVDLTEPADHHSPR